MGDVELALAFVARRAGLPGMPAAQWALTLSLDLGWMSPSQAAAFVERARQAGVLQGDGVLRFALDPHALPTPPRFRPDPEARPETVHAPSAPAGTVDHSFLAWVDRYAKQAGCDRAQALQRIADLQDRMGGMLNADVAVLWLAREAGLDVRSAAQPIRTPA